MAARHTDREQRRQAALAMRQEGHSLRAIARSLGVGKDTIRADLRAVEAERARDGRRRWTEAKKNVEGSYSEVVSLALAEILRRLEGDPGAVDVAELRQLVRDGVHVTQLLTGDATERHHVPTEQVDAEIDRLLAELGG